MKLQQLRYVVEIVKHGYHLSAAAEALNTSQPGVSRQIKLLESELGVKIFLRTRNRITCLTEPGEHVFAIAKDVLTSLTSLRSLKMDLDSVEATELTIATTHTQARYILPNVVLRFIERYPNINLVLKQGDPESICQLVEDGEVDFAVGPKTMRSFPKLLKLEVNKIGRILVGKEDHPIFKEPILTYELLAAHSIIAYDTRYSGRWQILEAFRNAGYEPHFSLSAIDADVSKTYASLGLGLAVLTEVAYNAVRDVGLVSREVNHLFPPSTTVISMRPSSYVRPVMLEFIASLSDSLTTKMIEKRLKAIAENQ